MFWRHNIPERFKKEDLPKNADGVVMAATFISSDKCPHLKVKLESIDEIVHPVSGAITRQSETGFTARFKHGLFSTTNKALMVAMIKHRAYNAHQNSFTIDHHDPTGLWRAMGVVEITEVPTFIPKSVYKVDPSPTVIGKQLKAIEAKPPEAVETLVGLA